MQNKDLIARINEIDKMMADKTKMEALPLRVRLLVARNYRAMLTEYNVNYTKDLQEINGRYFDEEEGEGDSKIQKLKDGADPKEYANEIKALMEFDADVAITKISAEDAEQIDDFSILLVLEFLIEEG